MCLNWFKHCTQARGGSVLFRTKKSCGYKSVIKKILCSSDLLVNGRPETAAGTHYIDRFDSFSVRQSISHSPLIYIIKRLCENSLAVFILFLWLAS